MNAIVEFNILSEGDAIKWVEQQAKKANCPIGKDTARFFVATVGKDMLSIKNEFSAAVIRQRSRNTKEMVSHVVISNVEYKIYVMYDYFAAQFSGKASARFFNVGRMLRRGNRNSGLLRSLPKNTLCHGHEKGLVGRGYCGDLNKRMVG